VNNAKGKGKQTNHARPYSVLCHRGGTCCLVERPTCRFWTNFRRVERNSLNVKCQTHEHGFSGLAVSKGPFLDAQVNASIQIYKSLVSTDESWALPHAPGFSVRPRPPSALRGMPSRSKALHTQQRTWLRTGHFVGFQTLHGDVQSPFWVFSTGLSEFELSLGCKLTAWRRRSIVFSTRGSLRPEGRCVADTVVLVRVRDRGLILRELLQKI